MHVISDARFSTPWCKKYTVVHPVRECSKQHFRSAFLRVKFYLVTSMPSSASSC